MCAVRDADGAKPEPASAPSRPIKAGNMKHLPYPPDGGLKEPVRAFKDTFSAVTVLKEMYFPGLLTEREKQQIAHRDRKKD
jgi:hypothetical protein